MYGQLQNIVVKELGVPMDKYGIPTDAMSWDGLGFHWMLKPHLTVAKKEVNSLMPTQFLGVKGTDTPAGKPAPKVPAAAESDAEKEAAKLVVASASVKEFQLKAMRVPAVVNDDALMAKCLDDGPDGFYATHKG